MPYTWLDCSPQDPSFLKELQVQTIDDFRLKIEYLRNSSNFINEKTERT